LAHRRILSTSTVTATLASAGHCRATCVRTLTEAPIGGPAHLAAQRVLEAIDGLGLGATGDRTHVHLRPPKTP
jgi:hypothetical protein